MFPASSLKCTKELTWGGAVLSSQRQARRSALNAASSTAGKLHFRIGSSRQAPELPSLNSKSVGIYSSDPRNSSVPVMGNQSTSIQATKPETRAYATTSDMHRAFIALGSNMGNKLETLEQACKELQSRKNITLVRTSGLWQTKAMYVTNQDDFLNGACEIETTLQPLELLDTLQSIENSLGRKRLVEKGPRTLDLDILLYDDKIIDNERLIVPHKLMLERAFVLHPLCQMIPKKIPATSTEQSTFLDYLTKLPPAVTPMSTTTHLSASLPPLQTLLPWRTTYVMSILNTTPDSFSDGGVNAPTNLDELRNTIASHLAAGATIIDIGGQSTRPNAAPVTAKEEISRVVPAIKVARSMISDYTSNDERGYAGAISIDTYRASVARAAIEAGADIINDVSAGTLDSEMLSTMADLGCTVVLMHMRGDPSTMTNKENTSYPEGVVETVGRELLARVQAAEAAGVRRWRIILDPGIGFAKTQGQNLELLRRLDDLKRYPGLEGYPWLVGASRKGFIGKITGVTEARERSWGTAATVAANVQGGADIVRVHDVDEMTKVVKMADAIWRHE